MHSAHPIHTVYNELLNNAPLFNALEKKKISSYLSFVEGSFTVANRLLFYFFFFQCFGKLLKQYKVHINFVSEAKRDLPMNNDFVNQCMCVHVTLTFPFQANRKFFHVRFAIDFSMPLHHHSFSKVPLFGFLHWKCFSS